MFLKLFFAILLIASIAFPIVVKAVKDNRGESCKIHKGHIAINIITSLVLLVFSFSFVIIPTGYTGVRTTFGQIDPDPVSNGFNFKIPFVQSIEKVNNKQQDISFGGKVWSETKERTAIYYDEITVTYQINPKSSAWIYANVTNYKDALINQGIVASSIKASSKTLSDTDATNRSLIEPLVMKNLQESLNEKYGDGVVDITKVIIGNADFEDSYNLAIAAKQQAQLEAEKQQIENQRAIEKAEADAKVKQTSAEAEANAKLISAKAEAEANELLEKSLTEQILKEMWLEKWDGQLPKYLAGDEASAIVNMGE